MAYKIAVATSDGEKIDLHFGETEFFYIYEIDEKKIKFLQKRAVLNDSKENAAAGGGCCREMSAKVNTIKDCRGVLALKIGFNAQKMLSTLNISVFDDIDCSVQDAISSIAEYFFKVDNHQNLSKPN